MDRSRNILIGIAMTIGGIVCATLVLHDQGLSQSSLPLIMKGCLGAGLGIKLLLDPEMQDFF